jgi:hypothetical protein
MKNLSKLEIPFFGRREKGQAIAMFALVSVALVLFVLGVMDYMITTSRTMDAVAVADLSAHAGAQEVLVRPNGVIENAPEGPAVAAQYFSMQAPSYVRLTGISCGSIDNRPACEVTVQVRSAGYLIPTHWVTVRAVGYLAYGVTRGDQ